MMNHTVQKETKLIVDKDIDVVVRREAAPVTRQRGIASVDNTLNFMTGDISYEELKRIPGVSTMALRAKENAGDVSIFQKKDYTAPLAQGGLQRIAYWNLPLLSLFVSESGRIVPIRISGISKERQKQLEHAIKIARFLALMPFMKY